MRSAARNPNQIVIETIRNVLTERSQKNRSYSVRALARDLSLSPSFLSQILSGKRRLFVSRAEKITSDLNLSRRVANKFLKAAALANLTSGEGGDRMNRLLAEPGYAQEYSPVEIDKFEYFNSWYHVAIADLTTCDDFRSDVSWIASRLGLSETLVQSTIARLLRLSILEQKGSKIFKTNLHVSVPTLKSFNVVRNFHLQMIEKAKENLQSESQEDFEGRHISGITFAIPTSKIELLKNRIQDFKRELVDLLEDESCQEVYQFNVQFFPLTTKRGKI